MQYVDATILGIFTGAAYALVAVSITLMFRSTGVLSFAHAAFATTGAYLYYDFSILRSWPTPIAALGALALTVVYGLVIERFAIRRVRGASSATKLIVTLGVVALTIGLMLQFYGFEPVKAEFLLPQGSFVLRKVHVSYQEASMLLVAAASALSLGWFLKATRFGVAVRGVAQNAEAARLMGVSLTTVARFNWGVGALLAGITGILTAPLAPINAGSSVLLLVKALTGTLFGGLASLPLAFVGGITVGVVQAVTVIQSNKPGAQELATLFMVVALLVFRRSWAVEIRDESAGAHGHRRWALPRLAFLDSRPVRLSMRTAGITAIAGLALIAIVMPMSSNRWAFVGAVGLYYVIEALSLVLLVGWGGQVSLMQGAYVGIGAFMTVFLVGRWGWPLELAIPSAALSGVAMGAIVGIPALRLTGLQFGIASLAFGGATAEWLLQRPSFPRYMDRGEMFGIDIFSDTNLYFIMVPVTLFLYWMVWNVRRSTYGALLISARDASSTVAHFGADPKRTRMWAFLLASFIASLGGAFYGVLITSVQPSQFSVLLSMSLLIYAVVGGLQSLLGPLIAGFMFGVLPQIVQDLQGAQDTRPTAIPDIVAGLFLIVLISWRPDGIASLFRRSAGHVPSGGMGLGNLRFGRFDLVVRNHRRPKRPGRLARPAQRPASQRPAPKQAARLRT